MAAALFRGWPEQAGAMEWRDVDECDEWRESYGRLVPVLTVGDAVVCELRPDLDRIGQYFGASTNPV